MFQEEEYQKIIHEIKNSICIIGSSLQLIEKQHPEVTSFRYWDSTMSDISRLNTIFNDIATARLCDNMHPVVILASEFLEDLKLHIDSLFNEDITCIFQLEDSLPYLKIDANVMQHALLNLVKNAIEAIKGTGTVQISAYVEKENYDENYLVIQVKDNGCGIPKENMPQLFAPLYSSKENGSGLGLVITKQIITSHQGNIYCTSVPGIGTTFTINLPIWNN